MAGIRKKSKELKDAILRAVNEFFLSEFRSPHISEIAGELGVAKSTVYRYLIEMNEEGMLSYDGKTIKTRTTRRVDTVMQCAPVAGSIPCGGATEEEESIEEFVPLSRSLFGKGDFFILKANGDSMVEAGIDGGDLVVIRKQSTARDGEIAAVLEENKSTLKYIFYELEKKRVRLQPANKTMKPIYIKNLEGLTIQGVAQHVIKKL